MSSDKIIKELLNFKQEQLWSESYTPDKANAIRTPITKSFNGIPLTTTTWNQFYNGYPIIPNVNKGIDNLSMVYNQMLYQSVINEEVKKKAIDKLNSSFFKKHLKNIFFPILILSIILILVFFIKYYNTYDKNIKDNYIALGITVSVFWSILYIICIGPYINLIVKNKELWKIYNIKKN
jgi:hypothetical protein